VGGEWAQQCQGAPAGRADSPSSKTKPAGEGWSGQRGRPERDLIAD